MNNKFKVNFLISSLTLCSPFAIANTDNINSEEYSACLSQQLQTASDSTTLGEIRTICQQQASIKFSQVAAVEKTEHKKTIVTQSAIRKRLQGERSASTNPYVLTPHKMNYVLPAYTTNHINRDVYENFGGYTENLDELEAKFQLSLKVPLYHKDIFNKDDGLFFAFTLESWWQVYADNISKPFRETNYQPEIFYYTPTSWQPFGGNTSFVVGVEHQSNGKAQHLSRSWNRLYTNFIFEKGDFALSIKPWHRFKEDAKEYIGDPKGDDNPDIDDYLGHFELGMVYEWGNVELNFMGRRNFATEYGATQFGITFPLWGKIRGYANVFNGYGESLIDYNHKQTRYGIGFTLNNIL